MTVSSTSNRKTYTGDDVTVAFATSPVVFFDETDLEVYLVTTATGASVQKTLTTDYTVSGGSGSTGTVTMLTAPASTETLVILRVLPITQADDFINNDLNDAEVLEDRLDKMTMVMQQLDETNGRAIRLESTETPTTALTELPFDRASKYLGFGASKELVALAAPTDTALTTAYAETLLDDADAAAARVTLGFSAVAAKGDLFVGTAADTIGTQSVGTDGYNLQAQSGASKGLQYLPAQHGYTMLNGYLAWSVASSILTVAIKTWAGTDPSATDPVYVAFRSATAATGSLTVRKITAATSISINDTATLGTVNSTAFRIWAVLFDDGGTLRMGVINCRTSGNNIYPLGAFPVASSTLESDSADSAHVFYTDTAGVTSKAYAVLGYATWESGLATAGTWSSGPTRVQLYGLGIPLPGHMIQEQLDIDGASNNGTTTIPFDSSIPQQTGEGNEFMSVAITPTSAANVLDRECVAYIGSNSASMPGIGALFDDSTENAVTVGSILAGTAVSTGMATPVVLRHRRVAAGTSSTTCKFKAGTSLAATTYFNNNNGTATLGGVYSSRLSVKEIMA